MLLRYYIRLQFGVLKTSLYSPAGGYLCYFVLLCATFVPFKQQTDSKQDINLKDVILALSWGA